MAGQRHFECRTKEGNSDQTRPMGDEMSAVRPRPIAVPRFIRHPGLHSLRKGKLNLIAGAGGENKSTLAMLYAARETQHGHVVCIISTEDEWDEVGPRLEAATRSCSGHL